MSGKTIASGAKRRALGATCCALAAAAVLTAVPIASAAVAAPTTTPPSGSAPGGPGAQSYLDVARKDCFGTARNTTSKVWFTVAGGVLSDVFSPNIEATNVNTVQYIVTDGQTFADLQQRNMTYSLSSPDRSGMVCQVTSTDAAHGFGQRRLQRNRLRPGEDSRGKPLQPGSGGARPRTPAGVGGRVGKPSRHHRGSSIQDSFSWAAIRLPAAGLLPQPRLRRDRIRARCASLPPCRPVGRPWSAGHNRCPAPARPFQTPLAARGGCPFP